MSGINAILFFAPRMFEWAGLGHSAALLSSVGVGITNLVMTLLGIRLIDTNGRRTLLFFGGIGYIVSLGCTSLCFATGHFLLVPLFIFAFIGSHAVGQGTVIWVFVSELFPPRDRAKGQALGCSTHWCCAAIITQLFPAAVEAFEPAQIFGFFCFMMCLQMVWIVNLVPETRGVPLEEMAVHLLNPATRGLSVSAELKGGGGGGGGKSEGSESLVSAPP